MSFIDVFAGAGGLSLGLMRAGWKGLLAVERDKFAFDTLRHNLIDGSHCGFEWPSWYPRAHSEVGGFTKKYRAQLIALRGRIDLIAGGPPCQGFSFAGKRRKNDPRNRLFKRYAALVDLVKPKFLLLENVPGVTVEFGKKKNSLKKRSRGRPSTPHSQKIAEALDRLGYRVFPCLVKAVDFGVPQLRPRYILFGVSKELFGPDDAFDPQVWLDRVRIEFLAENHLPSDRPVTVAEAISDLETEAQELVECIDSPGSKQLVYKGPKTHYQNLLRRGTGSDTAPNSMRLANHRDETVRRFRQILSTCRKGMKLSEKDRERFGIKKFSTCPLAANKPAHTLTTLPDDFLHYSEPRILSVREYARLQSFPDWFDFKGKYTTGGKLRRRECPRYTQVANAVPPFLAEVVGRALQLIAHDALRRQETSQAVEPQQATVVAAL